MPIREEQVEAEELPDFLRESASSETSISTQVASPNPSEQQPSHEASEKVQISTKKAAEVVATTQAELSGSGEENDLFLVAETQFVEEELPPDFWGEPVSQAQNTQPSQNVPENVTPARPAMKDISSGDTKPYQSVEPALKSSKRKLDFEPIIETEASAEFLTLDAQDETKKKDNTRVLPQSDHLGAESSAGDDNAEADVDELFASLQSLFPGKIIKVEASDEEAEEDDVVTDDERDESSRSDNAA